MKNTLYVVAEFLAWVEILRREVQFLSMGRTTATRELQDLLAKIRKTFSTDEYGTVEIDLIFRLFRGEQRAIGEIMITKERSLTCIGYAEFVTRLDTNPGFAKWFNELQKAIEIIAKEEPGYDRRLIAIHDSLIDLLDFLDPKHVRVPTDRLRIEAG
jgi:hypothetical protein